MSDSFAWGSEETRFFYSLTPDLILDAVEQSTGLRCTGRAMALNSLENRVYELEIETDGPVRHPADRFVIAKFYRPGRWSREQIGEEHAFLLELADLEIPVVAPRILNDGDTLHQMAGSGLFYAVFPKFQGRPPDELDRETLGMAGRLLARLHNCGATRPAPSRVRICPATYATAGLQFLLDHDLVPSDIREAYKTTVEAIVSQTSAWFDAVQSIRLHGDCHLGNLLSNGRQLFFLDFDDMVMGPAVQDFWLMLQGRDEFAVEKLRTLLEAYESMRPFDRTTLRLIEPLRALRFVHFSAWIGKRWSDPAFPRAFPDYGTPKYWYTQLADMRDQLALLHEPVWIL